MAMQPDVGDRRRRRIIGSAVAAVVLLIAAGVAAYLLWSTVRPRLLGRHRLPARSIVTGTPGADRRARSCCHSPT